MTSHRHHLIRAAFSAVFCTLIFCIIWQSYQDRHLTPFQKLGPCLPSVHNHSGWDHSPSEVFTHDQIDDSTTLSHRGVFHRAPSDTFTQCYGKGCRLNGILEEFTLPDSEGTAFTKYAQLAKNGWQMIRPQPSTSEFAMLQPVLQDLGLPTAADDESWDKILWRHSKASTGPSGQTYPATNGYYMNIFNPEHGVIIATNNEGPAFVYNSPPADQLVPLRQWSDVIFLTWTNLCTSKDELQGLQYIIRTSIISPTTQAVLAEVAGGSMMNLKAYPGDEFDISSQQALALLGTPNGAGVAWMLAQHKPKLGMKMVTSIRIWDSMANDETYRAAYGPNPCMLFTIGDFETDSEGSDTSGH